MRDVVSEIKARLNIEDVVSSYVQLKKAGRSFKGLCPFHNEKTPSFIVSTEKQIAYCFGCHKGGDMFKFIEEVEGVDFSEAVKILADRAGLKVETSDFKPKNKEVSSLRETLLDIHEKACLFYQEKLVETKSGALALAYLKNRGIFNDIISEFRIGFAPDEGTELLAFLLKKGFKHDDLVKSGLFSSRDISGKDLSDKFRFRLIFPIFDYLGRVIGFGGRSLKDDQVPKYLNSPETAIYSKGKVLYGLSHSKKFIKESDRVIMVEGYFDLISLYKEGVKNVCASSGTALTSDQARLIKRFTKNVISCFDTKSPIKEDRSFNLLNTIPKLSLVLSFILGERLSSIFDSSNNSLICNLALRIELLINNSFELLLLVSILDSTNLETARILEFKSV